MEEEWRDITGLPGRQISSEGRMRSNLSSRDKSWRILSNAQRFGYMIYQWYAGAGKNKTIGVHRLVAMAFIPNTENKPHVNHINGVKNDNRAANLEWCTRSENLLHSCRVLRKNIGQLVHLSKLSNNDVYEIRSLASFGASQKDLALAYRVNQSTISRVLTGAKWKSI